MNKESERSSQISTSRILKDSKNLPKKYAILSNIDLISDRENITSEVDCLNTQNYNIINKDKDKNFNLNKTNPVIKDSIDDLNNNINCDNESVSPYFTLQNNKQKENCIQKTEENVLNNKINIINSESSLKQNLLSYNYNNNNTNNNIINSSNKNINNNNIYNYSSNNTEIENFQIPDNPDFYKNYFKPTKTEEDNYTNINNVENNVVESVLSEIKVVYNNNNDNNFIDIYDSKINKYNNKNNFKRDTSNIFKNVNNNAKDTPVNKNVKFIEKYNNKNIDINLNNNKVYLCKNKQFNKQNISNSSMGSDVNKLKFMEKIKEIKSNNDNNISTNKSFDQYLEKDVTNINDNILNDITNTNFKQTKDIEVNVNVLKEENDELKYEIHRLNLVISALEIDCNNLEINAKEKEEIIINSKNEIESLIEENNFLKEKIKLNEEEIKQQLKTTNNISNESNYDYANSTKLENTIINKLDYIIQNNKDEISTNSTNMIVEQFKLLTINLKKEINTLKNKLKAEESNYLETKINYSKLLAKLQEDKQNDIIAEGTKAAELEKCLNLKIKELKKENNELILKKDEQIKEKDNQITYLKRKEEAYKNSALEKSFIKIEDHDKKIQDLNNLFEDKIKQMNKDFQLRLDKELNNLKDKIANESKNEYMFLTENIRNNLLKTETSLEVIKKNEIILENENKELKLNNKKLSEDLNDAKDSLKIANERIFKINSKLDDYYKQIQELTVDNNNIIINKNKIEFDLKKELDKNLNYIESIKELKEDLQNKTNDIKDVKNEYEDQLLDCKNKHIELNNNLKSCQYNYDQIYKELNSYINKYQLLESEFDKYIQQNNEYSQKIEYLNEKIKENEEYIEKCSLMYSKSTKELNDFKSNYINTTFIYSKPLLVKLCYLRKELENIKQNYKSDLIIIKKDQSNQIELLLTKFKLLLNDKLKQGKIELLKNTEYYEGILKENSIKNEEKIKEKSQKISKEYEKYLFDITKKNEKLVKENEDCNNKLSILEENEIKLEAKISNLLRQFKRIEIDNNSLIKENSKLNEENNAITNCNLNNIHNLKNEILTLKEKNKTLNSELITKSKCNEKSNNFSKNYYLTKFNDILLYIDSIKNKYNLIIGKCTNQLSIISDKANKLLIKNNDLCAENNKLYSDISEIKKEIKYSNEVNYNYKNYVSNYKENFEKMKETLDIKSNKLNKINKNVLEIKSMVSSAVKDYSDKGLTEVKMAQKLDLEIKEMLKGLNTSYNLVK